MATHGSRHFDVAVLDASWIGMLPVTEPVTAGHDVAGLLTFEYPLIAWVRDWIIDPLAEYILIVLPRGRVWGGVGRAGFSRF